MKNNKILLSWEFPWKGGLLKHSTIHCIFDILQQLRKDRWRESHERTNPTKKQNKTKNNYKMPVTVPTLTRGFTRRLPMTLNILDNPRGVHTMEDNQKWIKAFKNTNLWQHTLNVIWMVCMGNRNVIHRTHIKAAERQKVKYRSSGMAGNIDLEIMKIHFITFMAMSIFPNNMDSVWNC